MHVHAHAKDGHSRVRLVQAYFRAAFLSKRVALCSPPLQHVSVAYTRQTLHRVRAQVDDGLLTEFYQRSPMSLHGIACNAPHRVIRCRQLTKAGISPETPTRHSLTVKRSLLTDIETFAMPYECIIARTDNMELHHSSTGLAFLPCYHGTERSLLLAQRYFPSGIAVFQPQQHSERLRRLERHFQRLRIGPASSTLAQ